jgi:hypothetical protein
MYVNGKIRPVKTVPGIVLAGWPWFTPVILATQEVEIRSIWTNSFQDPVTKRAGRVAQG